VHDGTIRGDDHEEVSMRKLLVPAAVAALALPTIATAAQAPGAASTPTATDMTILTLTVRNSRFGRVLFDGKGRVLYGFTRDKRGGKSTCYGACAAAWPVYFKKGVLRAGNGVNRSLIGTVKRRDGRLQVTYNGWPLYYYAHEGPGQILCQNVDEFGGLWLVVRPSGALVR
jgi:predicted lipoprotein with Yx(FWY)xxD motif